MRRLTIVTFYLLLSINLFGQGEKEPPTIQIVGTSKVSVKPDIGVLVIQITSLNMNFSQSIIGLNDKTKAISKQIMGLGFKEEEIKTTDFEIEVNRVYRREETIDSGYVARQSVKVEFKNQKETITKILNTFSKSRTDFTLNFDFKLSDDLRTKVQDELLKLAIKDAKDKAKLIAESSGVKIRRIKDINYGLTYYGGMREVQEHGEYLAMASSPADTALIGFTPNDLLFEDSVLMTWEIE
ncbi:MAG: SIMPL domain-containing protein [Flammeovirgaceae bacterium]|jgi:uncharacterized protein YggE|nr:SIMPL domain-containing protein [Flammeovirgaceae bacterium]